MAYIALFPSANYVTFFLLWSLREKCKASHRSRFWEKGARLRDNTTGTFRFFVAIFSYSRLRFSEVFCKKGDQMELMKMPRKPLKMPIY